MLILLQCGVKFVLLGCPFPGPWAKRADLSHACVGLPAPGGISLLPRNLGNSPMCLSLSAEAPCHCTSLSFSYSHLVFALFGVSVDFICTLWDEWGKYVCSIFPEAEVSRSLYFMEQVLPMFHFYCRPVSLPHFHTVCITRADGVFCSRVHTSAIAC